MDVQDFVIVLKDGMINFLDNNKDQFNYLRDNDHETAEETLSEMELNRDSIPMDFLSYYLEIDGNFIPTELGDVRMEDFVGGYEGAGEFVRMVLSIEDYSTGEKQYFACDGYYSSWMGTSWEEGNFVKVYPYKKTIIEYSTQPLE